MSESGRVLWIVDPSLNVAEDQGTQEIAERWGGPTRIFQPALKPGDGPNATTGHDAAGVVIMGSAASVHDEHAWLDELAAWLRPIVEGRARVPLLGICFGHQLIAHLAGSSIGWLDPDERRKRVGIETTQVRSAPRSWPARDLSVVVSHREIVETVPDGFDVIGSRRGVAIDALRHRSLPIVSYQFHPEARDEFARRAGIDTAAIDARVVDDSRGVLDAFCNQARGERDPTDAPTG